MQKRLLAVGHGPAKSLLQGPLTYYHNRSPKTGDTVLVGATDPRAREARTIDNYAKERSDWVSSSLFAASKL